MIVYNFHASNTILSRAIRACSDGKFSHVSIWVDGYIYEAHIKEGVRKYKANWSDADDIVESIYIEFSKEDEKRVKKFLNAQVGKKYDLFGVLSFIWFFLRPKDGQWFCSEYAMVSYMKLLTIKSCNYDQKQSPFGFYLMIKTIQNAKNLYKPDL